MASMAAGRDTRRTRLPAAMTLALATTAINLLGLVIPLMAQLVFSRILPNPGSPTLPVIVAVVIMLGLVEIGLNIGRSYLTMQAGNEFFGRMFRRSFQHIVASRCEVGDRGSARAIELMTEINRLRAGRDGQLVVQTTDILFIPIILGLILYVAPLIGLVVALCLAGGFLLMTGASRELQRRSQRNAENQEARYRFLFRVLASIHPLKALGAEDFVIRRYEALQAESARMTFRSGLVVSRFMMASQMLSHLIVAVSLITGAIAVNSGLMTLGAMSSVTLLSARLLGPLQRAVLARTEREDRERAADDLAGLLAAPDDGRPSVSAGPTAAAGRLSVTGLSLGDPAADGFADIAFQVEPGETVAISGGGSLGVSRLLHCCAGLVEPEAGEILLAGHAVSSWSQGDLDSLVAYVPAVPVMFAGTIAENLTLFGKVTIDEAMAIATIIGVRELIDELPAGLETPLLGGLTENIPAGLCQQLSLVRALVHRPRLILLDHVDRGLDRDGYARLNQFLAIIRGQASLVIASDDGNLAAGATRRWRFAKGRLVSDERSEPAAHVAYRSLKL